MDTKEEKAWRLMKSSYSFQVRVTASIYDVLLKIIESGAYLNFFEYGIDLMRKDIKDRGITLEAVKESIVEEEEPNKRQYLTEIDIVSTPVPIIIIDLIR